MKYKCIIPTLMIALILGVCFAGTTEAQLNDMEMSKIVGKACCGTTSYGSCTGSGGPCGSSCMTCSNYTISGTQGQTCTTVPGNELNCTPNGTVICKISVICDKTVYADEDCAGAISGCQPETDKNCGECGYIDSTNITIPTYYCG